MQRFNGDSKRETRRAVSLRSGAGKRPALTLIQHDTGSFTCYYPMGWRSLLGCSPWGRYESDTTEGLHFHFSLSCIGEGNGNPLQCSCLENPRDGGAWWAAVYGVAQSRTRLKRLSSSSSSSSTSKRNKWKPCWLERKNKTAPIAKWHYHIENWMLLEIIESAMSQYTRSTYNNHICVLTVYARKPKLKSLTLFIIMTRSKS